MAKKFVRNITDTKCKGRNQEPLETNRQNDLLSDEHDVYIRNKDYYHCLTNAIQKIESKNDSIIVSKKDKNTVELEYVGGDDGGGTPGTSTPTEIISKSKYIDVKETGTNRFELSTGQLEIELEEIRKLIEEMGNSDTGFIGNIPGYEFDYIIDNEEILNVSFNSYCRCFLSDYKTEYNINVGLVNFNVDSNCSNDLEIWGVKEIKNLEPLKAFNVSYKITNNVDNDKQLFLLNKWGDESIVKKENGLEYKGEYIVPANSIKYFHTTYYTDENSNLLAIFIKEGKVG